MTHTASLISITPKAEETLVYMARASNPKNQSNMKTAPQLLRYLLKHKHWSPFEMANMAVEINTTRAISAQIIRHRTFSFQEFSQRYADVAELPKIELPHLRRQDPKNKQASHDDLDPNVVGWFTAKIDQHYRECLDLYDAMLKHGIAKECAREILPMGSPTRIYMNGSLRSWIHYLQIRTGPETQLEHRKVAKSILDIFEKELPVVYEAAFT